MLSGSIAAIKFLDHLMHENPNQNYTMTRESYLKLKDTSGGFKSFFFDCHRDTPEYIDAINFLDDSMREYPSQNYNQKSERFLDK